MKIKGIVWVGTATERFDETVRFFKETLGLSAFHELEGLSILRLQGGEWVEVFGPSDPHFSEFDSGPVVEFLVDDLDEARAELEGKGVAFAGETFDTGVCHMAQFTDPDGNALMLHRRYAPPEGSA